MQRCLFHFKCLSSSPHDTGKALCPVANCALRVHVCVRVCEFVYGSKQA